MTWRCVFALLSACYGFTPAQILQLTDAQAALYVQNAVPPAGFEPEYEKKPGTEEFLKKLAEAYKRAGRKMPMIEV